jgi:hypothetical protein
MTCVCRFTETNGLAAYTPGNRWSERGDGEGSYQSVPATLALAGGLSAIESMAWQTNLARKLEYLRNQSRRQFSGEINCRMGSILGTGVAAPLQWQGPVFSDLYTAGRSGLGGMPAVTLPCYLAILLKRWKDTVEIRLLNTKSLRKLGDSDTGLLLNKRKSLGWAPTGTSRRRLLAAGCLLSLRLRSGLLLGRSRSASSSCALSARRSCLGVSSNSKCGQCVRRGRKAIVLVHRWCKLGDTG